MLLVRQYRHPVRSYLWELPAGLLDVDGEDPLLAARRELAEEADLAADEWHVLLDCFNSPGGSDRGVPLLPGPRPARGARAPTGTTASGEERDMATGWVPLDEARDLVLAGPAAQPDGGGRDPRGRAWPGSRAGRRCGPPTRRGRSARRGGSASGPARQRDRHG